MNTLKHLPVSQWPQADRMAFDAVYMPGDIFAGTRGTGAHLAAGTRRIIETGYRRWMGYLHTYHRDDLVVPPTNRITPDRVRAYIEQLGSQVRTSTVATNINALFTAARLMAPDQDWHWLKEIHARLMARATPLDRFANLVPAWQTLDLGFALMDAAMKCPHDAHHRRETRYRDGLTLALLSLWPIRRRSIAALTLTRHVILDEDGITLLLFPEDTKSKRAEWFRVPDQLVPYLERYLTEMRPNIPGADLHDGFWASNKRGPLSECQIYHVVRQHIRQAFGKAMGLHDMRRSAATFLAMEAPEQVGLIPGVLQHTGPEVSEKHYMLASSITASRRYTATIAALRNGSGLRYKHKKEGQP